MKEFSIYHKPFSIICVLNQIPFDKDSGISFNFRLVQDATADLLVELFCHLFVKVAIKGSFG